MSSAQNRAVRSYRARLNERGLARFEVLGRKEDQALLRSIARQLAKEGPEAARLRTEARRMFGDAPQKKGGILDALRRSPLVGANLNLTREREEGRSVDI